MEQRFFIHVLYKQMVGIVRYRMSCQFVPTLILTNLSLVGNSMAHLVENLELVFYRLYCFLKYLQL